MGAKNVYQKLQEIQSKLKAPKSQFNAFGKYNYRNCEDIQEAVKPLMAQVGAVLIISDEICQIGDRFYVKATASLIDSDTGEVASNTAYAREENEKKGMDASQVTGSTSSYARKYALNGLFCIDDTKDADTPSSDADRKYDMRGNAEGKSKDKEPDKSVLVGSEHINALFSQLTRTGIGLKGVLANFKLKDIHDMTIDQFRSAMNILEKKPDKPVDPATVPPEDMDDSGLPWNDAR